MSPALLLHQQSVWCFLPAPRASEERHGDPCQGRVLLGLAGTLKPWVPRKPKGQGRGCARSSRREAELSVRSAAANWGRKSRFPGWQAGPTSQMCLQV